MSRQAEPIVIIGGGPTGLGAAWELMDRETDWLLFEQSDRLGGLSTSYQRDGFTWDFGGHVMFSHYSEYDEMLDCVIPSHDWLWHERVAHIRTCGHWIPYPFQRNIKFLPIQEMWECLSGIIRLYTENVEPTDSNFQEFITSHFGEGIARQFMNPYNFKVWGYSPSEMSADWLAERVPRVDIERVISNVIHDTADVSWGPNNTFRFPVEGGTGEIWRRIADFLPSKRVRLNSEVVDIDPGSHEITLCNGDTFRYASLVSTMPINRLVAISGLEELSEPASHLRWSTVHVVGLGIVGEPPESIRDFCWMYFPEDNCPFYRATLFSNYSPTNAPSGHWSLMLETSETPAKPLAAQRIVHDCIEGCVAAGIMPRDAEVVSTWHHARQYAYPTPTPQRDDALNILLPALQNLDIFSRGRFGAWKYEVGNMDHSFMQGLEVAKRLVMGTAEVVVNQ